MTGRITGLAIGARTGMIRGQDGSQWVFCADAVLGDYDSLAIGHRVSFVVEREGVYTAVGVFREPVRTAAPGKQLVELPDLRYTGFRQSENERTYRFDDLKSLNSAQYCVTVDIALLLKHHIGVQEGPELCLHKLMSDLKDSPGSRQHRLRDEDLLALVALRAGAIKRRRPRHHVVGRRSPAPAFQHSGGAPESGPGDGAGRTDPFGTKPDSQGIPIVKAAINATRGPGGPASLRPANVFLSQ